MRQRLTPNLTLESARKLVAARRGWLRRRKLVLQSLLLEKAEPWDRWMVAVQAGDRETYARLLDRLVPALERSVESANPMTGSTDLLVQAIVRDVHRSRHTYRPEQPFQRWVGAIVSRHLRRPQCRE